MVLAGVFTDRSPPDAQISEEVAREICLDCSGQVIHIMRPARKNLFGLQHHLFIQAPHICRNDRKAELYPKKSTPLWKICL